ncbi:MAG: hypothetical protein IJS62_07145 [Bacteroidales bacterium]|nr:hypothetical protein [Bacteroidales bacterium]MBR0299782.1 hypothetical protein [Bacteroidales bacterium]
MRKKTALLCGLLLSGACAQEAEPLRTGDLVFVGIPAGRAPDENGMDAAISAATGRKDSLNFIHVAIVDADSAGVRIIDATVLRGVDRRPLDTFLHDFTSGDGPAPVFKVMRLRDAGIAEAAVRRARTRVGLPYDLSFLPDNGALYCSELVYESYLDADGKPIFPAAPMNFKNAEGEFPRYWQQLFERLGQEIPQGVPGTNPQAMSGDSALYEIRLTHSL